MFCFLVFFTYHFTTDVSVYWLVCKVQSEPVEHLTESFQLWLLNV